MTSTPQPIEAGGNHGDAEIIDFEARAQVAGSEIETDENDLDFSDAPASTLAEVLFSNLRHPTHSSLSGEALAEFLESDLATAGQSEPGTYTARLKELLKEYDIDDDGLYDKKLANDAVFRAIVAKQVESARSEDLAAQRHACLRLLELRAADPNHSSSSDDEWLDLIERLFS